MLYYSEKTGRMYHTEDDKIKAEKEKEMIDNFKVIDWTKETVKLVMRSGNAYAPKNATPEHSVTVCQGWCPPAYAIDVMPGYLRLRTYTFGYYPTGTGDRPLENATYRLNDYKSGLQVSPDAHFIVPVSHEYRWHYSSIPGTCACRGRQTCELRFYPDKIAIVYTLILPDQQIQYVPTDPAIFGLGACLWLADVATTQIRPDLTMSTSAWDGYRVVHNDAEIAASAFKPTYKLVPAIATLIGGDAAQDLRTRMIGSVNSYSCCKMADETQAAISAFLQCTDPVNDDRWEGWSKKTGHKTRELRHITDLLLWLATPVKKSTAQQTKESMAETYINAIPELQAIWSDPSKSAPKTIYWGRSDNAIIAIAVADQNYRNIRHLFAYDLKRKVRFYAEWLRTNTWNFPIPSAKMLRDAFDYCNDVVIIGGLTAQQLFAGTNAGWLLDNAKSIQIPDPFRPWASSDQQTLVSLCQTILTPRHTHWAMTALATTGQPLFEQLLKSGCSTLYTAALAETSHGSLSELFGDPAKTPYHTPKLAYNSKGKNLPQMLGVPLSFIREIEAHTQYTKPTYYRASQYELSVPRVYSLLKVMPTLAAADTATRQFWLKTSVEAPWGLWQSLTSALERLPDTTPARLAQLWQKYGSNLSYLSDYIKAQDLLKEIQLKSPGLQGLYNAHLYPKMPGKAIRFIHFVPGVIVSNGWSSRPDTAERFLERQKESYPGAMITPIYNACSELLGARIVMGPGHNLRYLHDQANYWVRFYGQEDKARSFATAAHRVDGLEWTDDKLGLTIRGPRTVEELNREGSMLMHSVASFADAIIAGSTNILFIRRTDMPDMPYYTVEIQPDGAIRQVHCYLNGGMSPEDQAKAFEVSGLECYKTPKEILRFLVNWAKAFPQNVDLFTLKREYKSYLAEGGK